MASQNTNAEIVRPLADYSGSVWGFHFLSLPPNSMKKQNKFHEQHLQELKEEVKTLLLASAMKPSQKLNLIDSIQRLGVSYHFETEIEEILQEMYKNPPYYNDRDVINDDDLCNVALLFRLLRQQGYKISCDIFNNFKNEKGDSFKLSLINDISGMLSLYEAAHLSIRGEDILDEALDFSTYHLKSMVTSTEIISPQYLKEKVIHALRWPIRKSLPRLDARYYISIYPKEDGSHENLLKFAKLDFNMLQALYQEELKCYTEWWQKSDFVKKLPYARERIVEGYFWGSMATFAPQYSISRCIASKMVAVLTMVDDTYDAFGTIDELKLLTEAIQRWDGSSMDLLPECMKVVYRDVILETFNEYESTTTKDGQLEFLQFAIDAFKKITRAYLPRSRMVPQRIMFQHLMST
ncbi:Terpene synthase [Quillaja saponaria]|uniref:Terpene synthase n=1 Tax=Quillaja saponaria TaxID=32244 RepID=A0AAD7QHW1_QUISA|nr:Terpene synthase [Quillaja saponaria]